MIERKDRHAQLRQNIVIHFHCRRDVPLAMTSCKEKQQPKLIESVKVVKEKSIGKLAKRKKIKPKTAGMLLDFEKLFEDQEKAIEAEEAAKKVEEHEVMTNVALNQTLEEFLKLDPDKDGKRVQELIEDLKAIGEPAIEALLPMVDQKLTSRQKRLVIMALGVLKGKDSSQEIYKRATEEQDAQVRLEALAALGKADDKEALAKKSVARIEAAIIRTTDDLAFTKMTYC